MGDLEPVLSAGDALAWVEAIRVFASLVIESRWGIPVIAYATGAGTPSSILSTYADLQIAGPTPTQAIAMRRWRRQLDQLRWVAPVTDILPDDPRRRTGRTTGR